MKSFLYFCTLVGLCLMLGCLSSSYNQQLNPVALNRFLVKDEPIRLITQNATEYSINIIGMDSINIEGYGLSRKVGDEEWNAFSGKIAADSIDLIQISKGDFGKSFIVYTTALALGIQFGLTMEGSSNPEFDIHYPGQGSCPFIYSWNGHGYQLEAEAFGAAFGRALELETSSVLTAVKPENSRVKIRIANRRPETHYINQVKLYSVETASGCYPVLDAGNNAWPVSNPAAPVYVRDHSQNEILQKIRQKDQQYWESDLANTDVLSSFNDILELEFKVPAAIDRGSLIITGINTKMINAVYDQVFGFLGDQSLAFVHAIENDTDVIETIKAWIDECSIKAFISDGSQWRFLGSIYPEANEVAFSRLIRLNLPENAKDTVKIKLSMLADVWKIDAVQIEWGLVAPLACQTVPVNTAVKNANQQVLQQIKNADDSYVVLFPPDDINLSFQSQTSVTGKRVHYILAVRGYLHEWITTSAKTTALTGPSIIGAEDRLTYLINLIKYKQVFLPPIYQAWKQYKNEYIN